MPEPSSTKLKFHMRAGNGGGEAWDLLVDDDPEWLNMTLWRAVNANNNMGDARFLLAWARHYPYGPNYFIFGGFFRVTPVIPAIIDGFGYDLELQDLHTEQIKRLIIKLDKPLGR